MRILAMDSSGLVASVALLDEETLLAEYTINYKKTHSQTLLPMMDEIVRMTETDLADIDAIAVAAGPGSFTGLRIGSATAKGLGMALDKPLVSVPTLEGLAANLWGSEAYLCPMMDARRKQVYTGIYRFDGDNLELVVDQKACPVEEILRDCGRLEGKVFFLGDGVPVYKDMIEDIMEEYRDRLVWAYAPAHLNRQRAGALGRLALNYLRQGRQETAADHAPIYLRKSQAERELNAKGRTLKE